MRDVVVAGTGMTQFGKFPSRSITSLTEEAVRGALSDAGLQPSDVGMVFFGNAAGGVVTGQEMIRGHAALRETGLLGVPIVSVENACASSSSAAHLAWMAVASGQVDSALAVGAEKLTHEDKQRAQDAIASAVDLEVREELERSLYDGDGPLAPSASLFMDIYAKKARDYMASTGASVEDFAQVVVKSHQHAALNPFAQYQNRVTLEEVLNSRVIAAPLTLMMCAPIGDGAAAVVLCADDARRRADGDVVKVLASVMVSGRYDAVDAAESRAAAIAYERASVDPSDLDLVELHDAAAPAELMLYEQLGLCAAGDGPRLLRSGATALGGSLPVNVSGGLLSKGHPVGATGCAQLVEMADQLRGRAGKRQVEGANLGMVENGGGNLGPDVAAATVHILGT